MLKEREGRKKRCGDGEKRNGCRKQQSENEGERVILSALLPSDMCAVKLCIHIVCLVNFGSPEITAPLSGLKILQVLGEVAVICAAQQCAIESRLCALDRLRNLCRYHLFQGEKGRGVQEA